MAKTISALFLISLLATCCTPAAAQQNAAVPSPDQTAPYKLRITNSEVEIDVIAVDAHSRPVLNLVPADLEVFDESDGSQSVRKLVSSLRLVDPSSAQARPDLPQSDFLGLTNGTCMLAYTAHYQLVYNPGPEGLIPGIHTIRIQANRRGLKLSYRHGYFVSPPEAAETNAIVAMAHSSEGPVNTTVQVGREGTLIAMGGNSFGSPVPEPGSLCADVYEIPENTKRIPDFGRLTPIGLVYTDFLSVTRESNVIGMGMPDIITRKEWVGLDYYGKFWITHPGTYKFQMISDDGAILEIDGMRVIDLDGVHPGKTGLGAITLSAGPHLLHIPFFNGIRAAVLILYVEAPGETMTLFNTQKFAAPPSESAPSRVP